MTHAKKDTAIVDLLTPDTDIPFKFPPTAIETLRGSPANV